MSSEARIACLSLQPGAVAGSCSAQVGSETLHWDVIPVVAEIEQLRAELHRLLATYAAVAIDGISSSFRIGDQNYRHTSIWQHLDLEAAGARFSGPPGVQNGSVTVWSGASGAPLRAWQSEVPDTLFGHWVMPVPDLGRDGLADVVITAPLARVGDEPRGLLFARSPKTGDELWRRSGTRAENFGWDLALADDHDGDGKRELFVGAPSSQAIAPPDEEEAVEPLSDAEYRDYQRARVHDPHDPTRAMHPVRVAAYALHPVGVAIDRTGALLVADDVGGCVWRVRAGSP